MSRARVDSFGSQGRLAAGHRTYSIFRLARLEELGLTEVDRLPFSIRVLLENALRNEDGRLVTREDVANLASYDAKDVPRKEIPYMPSRILLQDFTGVPAVVDLAGLRDAVKRLGGDPRSINPVVPVDLIIDHSVAVDRFASPDAYAFNVAREFERNRERYAFLKWAQLSFRNFRVVPPETGIVHQVNLECLSPVVATETWDGTKVAYPDSLVGTDSHTTMINGLGVMGWGVGGIEAEAVMLGQPYSMRIPEVVGCRLIGSLPDMASATDLVLTITQLLRAHGVVDRFVEYFGPGLDALTLADRATIANMAPEYGATVGFFPIDRSTLDYLELTGRPPEVVALVEAYAREQRLFRASETPDPVYTETVELDMSSVEPCLAGPKRPQDRLRLSEVKQGFEIALREPPRRRGFGVSGEAATRSVPVTIEGERFELSHGSVAIAAIASCTNTSNPSVMIAAGLVAKKALERGIRTKPWVKTSLAPGSRVVTDYLKRAGLLECLEAQRFHLVGYGCATCIGNSGPLPDPIAGAIEAGGLVAASVVSGNRNFEGRIHPAVKANYLASPPLVIAYALAGRIDLNLETDPIGLDPRGKPVRLRDIWPRREEIAAVVEASLFPAMFRDRYARVFEGEEAWRALPAEASETYAWDPTSTYIVAPPFFDGISPEAPAREDISNTRVLAVLGDSVTTDHISPAGPIPKDGPAGAYLIRHGVAPADFNSFGARRGNHEVMVRGTFENSQLKNLLLQGKEGGWTIHFPSGDAMHIYEAAVRYLGEGTPLIIIAGAEYGAGSSRDWAAKGPALLGIKAVIAEGFERIHRSNLIGMGVLPVQFMEGEDREALGLTGREVYSIAGIAGDLKPGKVLRVSARGDVGSEVSFSVIARLDTPVEVEWYLNGGIVQAVLRNMLEGAA